MPADDTDSNPLDEAIPAEVDELDDDDEVDEDNPFSDVIGEE